MILDRILKRVDDLGMMKTARHYRVERTVIGRHRLERSGAQAGKLEAARKVAKERGKERKSCHSGLPTKSPAARPAETRTVVVAGKTDDTDRGGRIGVIAAGPVFGRKSNFDRKRRTDLCRCVRR